MPAPAPAEAGVAGGSANELTGVPLELAVATEGADDWASEAAGVTGATLLGLVPGSLGPALGVLLALTSAELTVPPVGPVWCGGGTFAVPQAMVHSSVARQDTTVSTFVR